MAKKNTDMDKQNFARSPPQEKEEAQRSQSYNLGVYEKNKQCLAVKNNAHYV